MKTESKWAPRPATGGWLRTLNSGLVTLHAWEEPKDTWRARVNGLRLSKTFEDREQAQRAAEDVAEAMLERALADLEEG